MGSNEEDILLKAEDKIATLKTMITNWKTASGNPGKETTRQYCLGRAHGLEICLPTIKKLIDDTTNSIK